jgi:Na+-driven multidrug efflux pump
MSAAAVWLHAVTGTGNSRMTFLIELTTLVFYCIYVYLVLEVYHLSIFWGWVSEVLYWSLMFLLSLMYMLSGKWKKKVI